MKSPIDREHTLTPLLLEPNLWVWECPVSQGILITPFAYFHWLSQPTTASDQLPDPLDELGELNDSTNAKLCPESRLLMQRYRVGHGLDFFLDRAPNGNIWLDHGEWEQLRTSNLHHKLHLIFTSTWQNQIHDQELAERHHQLLNDKLGPQLLDQLHQLKPILKKHPHRSLALAYLSQ